MPSSGIIVSKLTVSIVSSLIILIFGGAGKLLFDINQSIAGIQIDIAVIQVDVKSLKQDVARAVSLSAKTADDMDDHKELGGHAVMEARMKTIEKRVDKLQN